MAARLREEHPDAQVETERGHLLELSVLVDDAPAYEAGPLTYPRPSKVVERLGTRRPGSG